jgi:hypothetical protein
LSNYIDKQYLDNLESKYNIVSDEEYSKLVHFQTTNDIPFQRWYPYREGYSYELVDKLIKKFNITGSILDPFVGSGSSVLAARYNNLKSYGIDVNPISIFIAKVENRNYKSTDVEYINEEIYKLSNIKPDYRHRTTEFNLADKYFNDDILQSLLQIRDFINDISDEKIRDVFFLSWLSVIESVSNVKKEGNGLKYKNRKRLKSGYINIPIKEWEDEHFPENKFKFVKDQILSHINIIFKDLKDNRIQSPEPNFYLGSAMDDVLKVPDKVELTVFSPPYVNFFDYFEIHKVELWLGQFINSHEELRKLKRTGMRSNASATVSKEINNHDEYVNHITNILAKKKLWSKKIPDVIKGYFDDMETLLRNLFIKTDKNGRVAIVIGNSAYGGIIVPSDLLVAEIAEKIGYKVENIIVTRHLTTSSQQRKYLTDVMNYMRESIVILKKE